MEEKTDVKICIACGKYKPLKDFALPCGLYSERCQNCTDNGIYNNVKGGNK